MKKRKNLVLLLFITAVAPFLLTGCFKFSLHLTVNRNGSADVDIVMAASRTLVSMGTGLENSLLVDKREQLAEQGFAISDYTAENLTGFQATKRMKTLEEFSSLGLGDDLGLGDQELFTVEKDFFFTTYHLNAEINLLDLIGDKIGMMALFSPDMRFILTLPVEPLKHNASSVSPDGKTLVWILSPTQVNQISLSASVPNTNALVTVILVVLILVLTIVMIIVRQKRKAAADAPVKK